MGRRRTHTPEEVVAKLRQVEVLVARGEPVSEAVRPIAVSEATYFRWRAEFGGLKLDQVKRLRALERENARLRKAVADLTLEEVVLKGAASGNWQARPAAGGASNEHVTAVLGVSERLARRVLGQHRSTQQKRPRTADDEAALTADVVGLARRYGRYGCRRVTALLRGAGWAVNHKRVERVRGTASDAEGSGGARG
jgi:putative transposase